MRAPSRGAVRYPHGMVPQGLEPPEHRRFIKIFTNWLGPGSLGGRLV